MKENSDKGTQEMFGVKRGRGRPKTGAAKAIRGTKQHWR